MASDSRLPLPTGAAAPPFPVLRASLFVLAALGLFPIVGMAVAIAASDLARLQRGAAAVLAATHLVTAGWGVMIATGALYQLLPAAAGVRRAWPRVMETQFAVHLAGLAVLVAGFALPWRPGPAIGGALLLASTVVLAVVTAAVVRARRRTLPVLTYVAGAVVSLVAAAVWGLVLALNRWLVFWPPLAGPAGLVVHVALGLVGWFGLLIVGVSYYLLPRFAGLREVPATRARAVLFAMAAGLLATVAAALAGLATLAPAARAAADIVARAGAAALGTGALLYAADLRVLLRAWRARAPDLTRAHWWVLLVETGALGVGLILWALGVLPGAGLWWGTAGVALFLLGWVTLAITGQAYKVTPFLMWYYRFARGLTAYEVPRLEAPYWPGAGVPAFVLHVLAAPLVATGILASAPAFALAGGIAYAAGAWLFGWLLLFSWLPSVRGGRRPREPDEAG